MTVPNRLGVGGTHTAVVSQYICQRVAATYSAAMAGCAGAQSRRRQKTASALLAKAQPRMHNSPAVRPMGHNTQRWIRHAFLIPDIARWRDLQPFPNGPRGCNCNLAVAKHVANLTVAAEVQQHKSCRTSMLPSTEIHSDPTQGLKKVKKCQARNRLQYTQCLNCNQS